MASDIPERPYLIRTLNEHQWSFAEEEYKKNGGPVVAAKWCDGFEFYIVEHEGKVKRMTTYKNDVYYHDTNLPLWKQT